MKSVKLTKDSNEITVFCMSCFVGYEEKVKREIISRVNAEVLFPIRIVLEKRKGVWKQYEKSMTPGYLFIYIKENIEIDYSGILGAIKILNYCGDRNSSLIGADREFALWVYNNKGIIDKSIIRRNNNEIEVINGPLKEVVSKIVGYSERKKKAYIRVGLENTIRTISLSAENIENLIGEK